MQQVENVAPAKGRGPGRPKSTDDGQLRHAIVEQARDAYLALGYAGTTMDGVAARCGISKRTLYRLFPAKADLFRAIVISHRNSMLDLPRPDDSLPMIDALLAIFRNGIGEEEDRERLAFIQLVMTEAMHFPELVGTLRRDGAEASRALLADWLARQARRGLLRIDNPQLAALMLMGTIFGVFAKWHFDSEIHTYAQRRAFTRMAIQTFVDGTRPR